MTVSRRHEMPFGAEVHGDRVRFRLWAPAQPEVELCLHYEEHIERLAMQAHDGWHECITRSARPGSDYSFRIDAGNGELMRVPDPASRYQAHDVHGPSQVVDPTHWRWHDDDWHGRPWHEAVIYELHTGTFSASGDFAGIEQRLDYLAALGVTAIELMPVADFPGRRNWGYDGVLPFAPDAAYGTPDDLKSLIDTAHAHKLMVLLDVVYNHFGPEGNYLHLYAPRFFTDRHHTPWGAAINFDGDDSHWVREYFIHNALYWLEEFHLDGLRLDAVHAIIDDSSPHILTELAERVHSTFGTDRHVHLVLENDRNEAHLLARDEGSRPRQYVAQWNDDVHHVMHVLLTGESGGYYADYSDDPVAHLGRCLTEGFAYQGEPSRYRADDRRGESTVGLPPQAFVAFLQNHDQIGNRAFGERIGTLTVSDPLRAMTAILLLTPSPPLLFMGQEWRADQPFLFFCDFGPDLSASVVEGRRREFSRFPEFADPDAQARIPDPTAAQTFTATVLDWDAAGHDVHADWLLLHRELLALRHRVLTPRLSRLDPTATTWRRIAPRALRAAWTFTDDTRLSLLANLGDVPVDHVAQPTGRLLYRSHPPAPSGDALQEPDGHGQVQLPAWSVALYLDGGTGQE